MKQRLALLGFEANMLPPFVSIGGQRLAKVAKMGQHRLQLGEREIREMEAKPIG
jgi:hypothetical protein